MARGKKTGGRDFKPGESGNPAGQTPLPADIKEARKLNKQEIERVLNKFLHLPLEELAAFVQDKRSPVLESLVARILLEAIKRGDQVRLEWVFQRLVGKIEEKINMTGEINVHRHVVEVINRINSGESKEVTHGKTSEEEQKTSEEI